LLPRVGGSLRPRAGPGAHSRGLRPPAGTVQPAQRLRSRAGRGPRPRFGSAPASALRAGRSSRALWLGAGAPRAGHRPLPGVGSRRGARRAARRRQRRAAGAVAPRPLFVTNGWTATPYRWFRLAFGLYLVVHFAQLLPWGAELFSSRGALPDAAASPLAF